MGPALFRTGRSRGSSRRPADAAGTLEGFYRFRMISQCEADMNMKILIYIYTHVGVKDTNIILRYIILYYMRGMGP